MQSSRGRQCVAASTSCWSTSGPNVGAINRAAVLASHHVVIPLAPDPYALEGLRILGPRLREWRSGWREGLSRAPAALELPRGEVDPLGYVVMQRAVRLDGTAGAHADWLARIPSVYRRDVLGDTGPEVTLTVGQDPHCVSRLEEFRSLMPLAREAGKPMFFLEPADGAIGGHAKAVQECYRDFRSLAIAIAGRAAVAVP